MNKYIFKLFKIVVILLFTISLVGCWDNYELDSISIVTGMGIDAAEDEDEINLTLHLGRVEGKTGYETDSTPQGKSFMVMNASDIGVLSAIDKLKRESTRAILLHHNEVVVFGKEELEKGIKNHMDFFLREHQIRMDTWILVSDSRAEDILTSEIEQEENSAIGLSKMIHLSSRDFETFSVRIIDLISAMMEKTTTPVIPIIKVESENAAQKLELSGLAILKDGKYIGKLGVENLEGYSWIKGDCIKSSLDVTLEQGYANIRMSNIKFKNEPKIKDGKPIISIDIKGDISFDEIRGFEDMEPVEVFKILEEAGENQVKKQIIDCFEHSQNLNADIYGFGAAFHKKYPRHGKQLKEHWDTIFPELEMKTNVRLKTMDTGKIMNSLEMGGN